MLLVLSFVTALSAGSVASWAVYDSMQVPPEEVVSAPIDLRALARDPGNVYDRTPVTPSPSPVPTASPTPAPTPLPAPAPAGTGFVRTPYVPPGQEPYRLVIDSIGVDAPVVAEYADANGVPGVPHNGWDVAWYAFTAAPGTGDNAVFAAHVTWNGAAVFYNLSSLAVGAQIKLEGDDGTTLLYTVTDSFLVNQDDPNSILVMRSTGYDSITLISCDGVFVNSGPFGDYTNRRVIRASLTEKYLASGAQPAASP
jgi:LPXTG-site transpeptidase (sortase) family protein